MFRMLFTVVSLLSLLLCVATVALGTRSFRTADGFRRIPGSDLPRGVYAKYLFSARGTLGYRMESSEVREAPADPSTTLVDETSTFGPVVSYCGLRRPSRWFHSPETAAFFDPAAIRGEVAESGNIDMRVLGFALRRVDTRVPFTPQPFPQHVQHYMDTIVGIPHWFIAMACAIAPIAWFRGASRGQGRTPGLCGKCGYDLRATPDRCPECGGLVQDAAEVSP